MLQAGREREGALKARIAEVEKSEADGVERERVLHSAGVLLSYTPPLSRKPHATAIFLFLPIYGTV